MNEAEQIREAADEVARAAEAYEAAKAKLAELLGVDRVGGGTGVRKKPGPKPKKEKFAPMQITAPHGATAEPKKAEPASSAADKRNGRASDVPDQILKVLEAGPRFFGDIMKQTGVGKSAIYRHLADLSRAGRIENRDGSWRIAA